MTFAFGDVGIFSNVKEIQGELYRVGLYSRVSAAEVGIGLSSHAAIGDIFTAAAG